MQKTKNLFDEFKPLLPKEFKEFSLNKSEDRTYVSSFYADRETHEMKGLEVILLKLLKFNLMMLIHTA